ncbi:MAG: gamma-glutamylcyclotransferase [Anaerolineae bacterium]|nr:gamma-glutamylcyclotransferase [Anaerolineae bacterium]
MESLFVYGTLQDPAVQQRVFGRVTEGQPDVLDGFYRGEITFPTASYPIAISDQPEYSIEGQVISVTPNELVLIDRYETAAYRRIYITLRSGLEAWVYCL